MWRGGVVVSVCLCAAASAAAGSRGGAGDVQERRRLAEAVLERAEAAALRAFDPRFRQAARKGLEALSLEELEAREAEGALGPLDVGASQAQLVYTPVTPCRLIDTRIAGGSMAAGAVRSFRTTGADLSPQGGSPTGCGVPFGPATAAVINFVAVNPVGPGFLRAWAYRQPYAPPPLASVLNYASIPSLNIANAIVVPLCDPAEAGQTCPLDFQAQADASNTHLVADVVGYFERFPEEQVRSFTTAVSSPSVSPVSVPSSCAFVSGAGVSVSAPVAGTVTVRGIVRGQIEHVQGLADSLSVGIATVSGDCAAFQAPAGESVPAGLPGDAYVSSIPVMARFAVAPGTHSFYLKARMTSGASPGDSVTGWFLEATFHPN